MIIGVIVSAYNFKGFARWMATHDQYMPRAPKKRKDEPLDFIDYLGAAFCPVDCLSYIGYGNQVVFKPLVGRQ